MTTSLKHRTCALAIGITLSSGIVLGQGAPPATGNPRLTGTSSVRQPTDTSAAFRESIRREIAGQRLVLAGQHQPAPPAKQKSWASRHKGLTALLIGVASLCVLVGYLHATYL